MMLAAAAAATQGFATGAPPPAECVAAAAPPTSVAGGAIGCHTGYYHLLSPEARQRLVEAEPAFETAALLQSAAAASWSFSSFAGNGAYPTSGYPADLRLHESESAAVAALNYREASSFYANRGEDESTTTSSPTSIGYSPMILEPPSTSLMVARKKTKKPFTIENIIAPDEGPQDQDRGSPKGRIHVTEEKKLMLSMPRPIYATAGFAMQPSLSDHHRPSYGAAT